MSKSDLQYAALLCGLVLALAACTRAVALLPVERTAAALEVAALAQLAISLAASVMLVLSSDANE